MGDGFCSLHGVPRTDTQGCDTYLSETEPYLSETLPSHAVNTSDHEKLQEVNPNFILIVPEVALAMAEIKKKKGKKKTNLPKKL